VKVRFARGQRDGGANAVPQRREAEKNTGVSFATPEKRVLPVGAMRFDQRAAMFLRSKKFCTGEPDPQRMKLDKLSSVSALRSAIHWCA
jgi:hypothetical protein